MLTAYDNIYYRDALFFALFTAWKHTNLQTISIYLRLFYQRYPYEEN